MQKCLLHDDWKATNPEFLMPNDIPHLTSNYPYHYFPSVLFFFFCIPPPFFFLFFPFFFFPSFFFFFPLPNRQGQGVGLPMAEVYARVAGGSVSMTSVPGVGTTVSFLLPADALGPGGAG